jgi:hypothetical protein
MVQNILRLCQNENIGLVYYSNYEVELLEKYLTANGKKVSFTKNLLEIIRKENIELPTFCYNSTSASMLYLDFVW